MFRSILFSALILLAFININAQICLLSDEFNNPTTPEASGWYNINTVEGWNAEQLETYNISITEPGHLVMIPHSCVWYGRKRGPFLFKYVNGDFVFTTEVHVTGRDGSSVPTSTFSLAGIMVRVPTEITNASTLTARQWEEQISENYIFLSTGRADGSCRSCPYSVCNYPPPHLEVKNTTDNTSCLEISPIESQTVILRIARIGSEFFVLYKRPADEGFTLHRQYSTTDFPNRLQVGLVAYTDFGHIGAAFNDYLHNSSVLSGAGFSPDLIARFNYARFNKVPVTMEGVDISTLSVTELEHSSRLGFASNIYPCYRCPEPESEFRLYPFPRNASPRVQDSKALSLGNGVVVTSLKLAGGKFAVKTWAISQNGKIKKQHCSSGGRNLHIQAVDAAKLSENRFLTTLQTVGGDLILQTWAVNNKGRLKRIGSRTDPAVSLTSVCSLSPNRVVTATKNKRGIVEVSAWEIEPSGSIKKLGGANAGMANDVAICHIGNSRVFTAIRTQENYLKMVVWQIGPEGKVSRLVESTSQPESISDILLQTMTENTVVTAVRTPQPDSIKLTAWEITDSQIIRRQETVIDSVQNISLYVQPATTEDGALAFAGIQPHDRTMRLAVWCWPPGEFAWRFPASSAPPASAFSRLASFKILDLVFIPERDEVAVTVQDKRSRMRLTIWGGDFDFLNPPR